MFRKPHSRTDAASAAPRSPRGAGALVLALAAAVAGQEIGRAHV